MLWRDWLLFLDPPVKVVNEEVSGANWPDSNLEVLMLKTSQMGPLEIAFSMNYSLIL